MRVRFIQFWCKGKELQARIPIDFPKNLLKASVLLQCRFEVLDNGYKIYVHGRNIRNSFKNSQILIIIFFRIGMVNDGFSRMRPTANSVYTQSVWGKHTSELGSTEEFCLYYLNDKRRRVALKMDQLLIQRILVSHLMDMRRLCLIMKSFGRVQHVIN